MAKRSTIVRKSRDDKNNIRWANVENPDEAHEVFTRWADHVQDRPAAEERRKRNLLYASLYMNLPILGFGVNSYTRAASARGQIALNATQNGIDSLVSKVCKNRPRPMFSTTEGDYELRENVENADKYADGHFMKHGYYRKVYPGKVLDACVYGLGVTKTHIVGGKPMVERTFPWELIFDDRECMYGDPITIGQRRYHDKQHAFDRFRRDGRGDSEWNKDLERAIDGEGATTDRVDFDRDENSEQVLVYEGWSAPTDKRPGKRFLGLRGKTIAFDDCDGHPFTFLRPKIPLVGIYGIGICERVEGIQREINRLLRDIQMAMHLIAKPHWMVEASSNVNATSLNNDIATIIKYSGAVPPQVYTPQSMSAEVFQHLQFLYRTLYEVCGISQLSAQSKTPAGVESAVAMRTYLNVETEYFNDFVRDAEESASEDAMRLVKLVAKTGTKEAVAYKPKRGPIEMVTWKKVDFDKLSVQVQPGSKLPDTPAGKREYALELAQYTPMGKQDIYELLEWDDTEAFAKRALAGKRNVERDIMRIRRGDNVIRDAVGDHQMALDMMGDAYEEAKHDGLPEKRLSVMRNYLKACRRYLGIPEPEAATAAPPQADPNAMGAPQMDPMMDPSMADPTMMQGDPAMLPPEGMMPPEAPLPPEPIPPQVP